MALGKDGNSKPSSSYKPYDTSNSFVKKLTSRVSGLIGWRSNSFESVNEQKNDISESSIDDGTTSPTAKRIKIQHSSDGFKATTSVVPNESSNLTQPIDYSSLVGPSNRRKCIASSTPANTYSIKNSPSFNASSNIDSSTSSNISLSLPSVTVHQTHNVTLPSVTSSPTAKQIKIQHSSDGFKATTSVVPNESSNLTQPIDYSSLAGPSNTRKYIASSTPANTYSIKNSPSFNAPSNIDSSTSSNISLSLPSVTVHQRHNVTLPSVTRAEVLSPIKYDINKSLNENWTILNNRRPSFNPDVLPASNERLSLSVCENRNRNCLSPFYSARTMYGGASALVPYSSQTSKRLRSETTCSKLNIFSPINQITIQPVPSPVTDSNDQETMSAASRRILDTLEKYCSPVRDAKRMPIKESSGNNSSGDAGSTSFASRGLKRKLSTLTQIMPSTTDLLRIKRQEKIRLNPVTGRKTEFDSSSSSSSDSTDLDYTVLTENTDKSSSQPFVGKIKRKNEKKFDDRPLTPVKLPNAVLKISNLPKFNITDTFTFSKPLLLENLDKDSEKDQEKTESGSETSVHKVDIKTVKQSSSTDSGKISAKVDDAKGSIKSFISPMFSSGSNDSSKQSSSPNSKPFVVNSTATKFSMSFGKNARWTCKKCLLDNDGERCSSCLNSRPSKNFTDNSKTKLADEFTKKAYDTADCPVDTLNQFKTNISSSGKSNVTVENVTKTENKFFSNATHPSGSNFVINSNNNNSSSNEGNHQNNTVNIKKNEGSSNENNSDVKDGSNNNKKNSFPSFGAASQSNSPSSVQNTSIVSNATDMWKNLQKQSDDCWKCDDCWVKNKKTDSKCVACGAPSKMAGKNEDEKDSTLPKNTFTFGIDHSKTGNSSSLTGASSSGLKFGSTDNKTTATTTTGFVFGFPAVSSTSSASVTATTTVPSSTSSSFGISGGTAAKLQFTFGSGSSGTTNSASQTMFAPELKKANSTITTQDTSSVTFGVTTASETVADNNKQDVVVSKPLVSNTTFESVTFNDVSSSTSNNDKKRTSATFNNDASKSVKSYLMSKENGEDTNSATTNTSNTTTFNDISSSTEIPSKRKISVFSSFFNKDSGANSTTSNFGGSNGFAENDFKLSAATTTTTTTAATITSTPASSAFSSSIIPAATGLTNSFGPLTNSFINSNGTASNALASTVANLSSSTSSPFNSRSEITTQNADDKSKLFPVPANPFGASCTQPSPGSIFGSFGSDNANKISTENSSIGSAVASSASTIGTSSAPTSFSVGSAFRFGASTTSNAQPVGGGFAFNGPKLDNATTPKFEFGSSTASSAFGTNATPFSFGSSTGTSAGVVNSAWSSLPTTTLKPLQQQSDEQIAINKPITAFGGTNLFGNSAGGPDLANKSGGFNFTPSNQLSTPTMNNFSCFNTPSVDNQDQSRLNNISASSSTPFVFGGVTNQASQGYNFGVATPPSTFNFTAGNASSTFSAQPTINAASAGATNPPVRRIKKAVRRSNK